MKKVFAVLIVCLASSAVGAKCITETYQVGGSVADREGNAVANADIIITWGGTTKWNGGSESLQSARDGSFSVDVPFDTLSGEGISGDICQGRLASVAFVVTAKGYREKRLNVSVRERKANVKVVLERHDG